MEARLNEAPAIAFTKCKNFGQTQEDTKDILTMNLLIVAPKRSVNQQCTHSRLRWGWAPAWPLVLLAMCLVSCTAQISNDQVPSSFFAAVDNKAYLDWLSVNQGKYTSSLFLQAPDGPENGVAMHWSIIGDRFHLAVAARATGWVGFGIAESGGMQGSDMVLYTAATNELVDAHVLEDFEQGPVQDECQSWTLEDSQSDDGFVIFQANRLLDTGDAQDRPIVNDASDRIPPTRVIAAWGDTETVSYHGPNSRVRSSVRFFVAIAEETEFAKDMNLEAQGSIELTAKDRQVQQQDTEYAKFCFSFLDLVNQGLPEDTNVHGIGIEALLDPTSERYVHHMVLYASESDWTGGDCHGAEFMHMAYVWAPGEGPLSLPPSVGAPLGTGGFLSFQLEIHYNNPSLDAGVVDSSGIKIYFTDLLREQEMGVLQLGDPFVNLYGTSVGEPSTFSQHQFDCPASCSSLVLGSTGDEVTVFREYLHMHQTGVAMKNSQIRNGEVIREGTVDFFVFDQQGSFAVQQEPFVIKPNDSFRTICSYNPPTTPTVFGTSSQEEMCIAFLFYYPRKKIFNQWPYTCGYDLGIPSCSSDWEQSTLQDPSQLERSFGGVPETCNLQAESQPPNTSETPSPTPSRTLQPLTSAGADTSLGDVTLCITWLLMACALGM